MRRIDDVPARRAFGYDADGGTHLDLITKPCATLPSWRDPTEGHAWRVKGHYIALRSPKI